MMKHSGLVVVGAFAVVAMAGPGVAAPRRRRSPAAWSTRASPAS